MWISNENSRFTINNIGDLDGLSAALEYIDGKFNLHDHSEIAWVSKEKMLSYNLAPADIPLAEYVKEMN